MRKNQVDVFEAEDMADIPANVLCRLAAEGKLKSRREPAAVIGRIQQRAALLDRFMETVINPSYPLQLAGVGSAVEAPLRAWVWPVGAMVDAGLAWGMARGWWRAMRVQGGWFKSFISLGSQPAGAGHRGDGDRPIRLATELF